MTVAVQSTEPGGVIVAVVVTVYISSNITLTYNGVEVYSGQASATSPNVYDVFQTDGYGTYVLETESGITGTITLSQRIMDWHDTMNNLGGAICFKDTEGKRGWTRFLKFTPDFMVTRGDKLTVFKDGDAYIEDMDSANNFFGDVHKSILAFRVFGYDGITRILDFVTFESTEKPDYVHVRAVDPEVCASDLCKADFVYDNGKYYAPAMKNKLSPGYETTEEGYLESLFHGDEMRASYFDVFFVFNSDFKLASINTGVSIAAGQKNK